MKRVKLAVLGTFVVLMVASGILTYVLRDQSQPGAPAGVATPVPGTQPKSEVPLLGQLFGPDASGLSPANISSWEATSARIALRFSLAAFLAGLLAFRPRGGGSYPRLKPFVAQTQILTEVVAGAMMMVVGDSAARAFGIFAAASLVRFRTNIRDPKEITVLLICLGVGLAAGVGGWDMAIILTLFVFLTLAVLEYFEKSQVFRSMEASVETKNVEHTNKVLMQIFSEHGFEAKLCQLKRKDEDDPLGKIV